MTWLLLLLSAGPLQGADIERSLRVPPADARGLRFSVKNRPATLELDFQMRSGGAPVRLVVMPEADEGRFKAGRSHASLAATEYQRSGKLKVYVPTPGEYVVMVDNRPEPRSAAVVELQGSLDYDMTPREAKELPPARRWTVVALSLMTFFTLVWVAGRRLWTAVEERNRSEPPHPFD